MALLVQFQPVGWHTLTTLITFDFGVMVPRNALTVRRRKYILLDIFRIQNIQRGKGVHKHSKKWYFAVKVFGPNDSFEFRIAILPL